MDPLPKMKARLRRIFHGEEEYGDGNAAEQARRYRLTELLPLTVEQAKLNSTGVPRQPVDVLVSLSGFAPETTILAYELLQPHHLMVICSEATRGSVETIEETLKLPPARLHVEECEPTDPLGIHRLVRKAVGLLPEDGGPRVIIDITGGKKVMSASAALAAAQLDLPLCYVDGRFDPELRQSEPGTERLMILDRPTSLFGNLDLDAGLVAFREGAFAVAHERFARAAGSGRVLFLRDLSDLYRAWCDLAFDGLAVRVRTVRARLAEPWAPAAVRDRVRAQLDFLETLAAASGGPPILINFYLLGEHHRRLGRHDLAALLSCRAVESAFELRLGRLAPGFLCGRPDYGLLAGDPAELAARYVAVAAAVHGAASAGLPTRVGLVDAALLLYVLRDPILERIDVTDEAALRDLAGLIDAREGSVLARGTGSVTVDVSERLGDLALRTVRAFWGLEFGSERVDETLAALRFVGEV